MYQEFDIVWAKLPWNGCEDERPWLIVKLRPNGEYGAFPIASRHYHESGGPAYLIQKSHPDFPATGLAHESYVFYESTIEIGEDEIRKRIGSLGGEALNEVLTLGGYK